MNPPSNERMRARALLRWVLAVAVKLRDGRPEAYAELATMELKIREFLDKTHRHG